MRAPGDNGPNKGTYMDAIVRRALAALTVIGLLIGGGLYFVSYRNVHQLSDRWAAASTSNSDRRDRCESKAQTDREHSNCTRQWLDGMEDTNWMLDAQSLAGSRGMTGVYIVAVSLLLWPLYFLVRWITTGSLRRKRKEDGVDSQA